MDIDLVAVEILSDDFDTKFGVVNWEVIISISSISLNWYASSIGSSIGSSIISNICISVSDDTQISNNNTISIFLDPRISCLSPIGLWTLTIELFFVTLNLFTKTQSHNGRHASDMAVNIAVMRSFKQHLGVVFIQTPLPFCYAARFVVPV